MTPLDAIEELARRYFASRTGTPTDELLKALHRAIDQGTATQENERHRTVGDGRPRLLDGEEPRQDPIFQTEAQRAADRVFDHLAATHAPRRQEYDD